MLYIIKNTTERITICWPFCVETIHNQRRQRRLATETQTENPRKRAHALNKHGASNAHSNKLTHKIHTHTHSQPSTPKVILYSLCACCKFAVFCGCGCCHTTHAQTGCVCAHQRTTSANPIPNVTRLRWPANVGREYSESSNLLRGKN